MEAAVEYPDLLNLGCGDDYREQWHNVDINEEVPADEYRDLEETPWPYPDEAFARIRARHVLEHLETVPWEELYRVLQPGGELVISYPMGHTRDEDVTHEQRWNYNTPRFLAGETDHDHEICGDWEVANRQYEYAINGSEPLIRWYVRYRLAVVGPGVWLEQIPGLSGEWTARLRKV